jgi:hypothetical protein
VRSHSFWNVHDGITTTFVDNVQNLNDDGHLVGSGIGHLRKVKDVRWSPGPRFAS